MTPNFDRSARMAYKTLLALHIDTLPVDPLSILSFCNNTVVHTYEELMRQIGTYSDYYYFKYIIFGDRDAVTVRRDFDNGKTGYEVFYDDRGNPYRRRFTLAHELGHVILKHTHEEWWEEREADWFASHLLAPAPLLTRIDCPTPEKVASVFAVSEPAARVVLSRPVYRTDLYDAILRQFSDFRKAV